MKYLYDSTYPTILFYIGICVIFYVSEPYLFDMSWVTFIHNYFVQSVQNELNISHSVQIEATFH